MNILHRRQLGYLLDACNILTCKTARREAWINIFISNGNESRDLNTLSTILDRFPEIDPKALLLGYCERKKGSMISNLFYDYADEFIGKWDLDSFLNYILDVDILKNHFSNYYFEKSYSDDILTRISEDTFLPHSIKALLFDFFLFPDRNISIYRKELDKIFRCLDKYYQENLNQILNCQEAFNYNILLSHDNSPFAKQKKWEKGLQSCYVSFAMISKYTLARGKVNDLGWIIMGYDYKTTFNEANQRPLDIAAFGNAFGDRIRVRIIELIVQNGEMTLADLAKQLGVVNTIAIYHLDILKKENLLLHRYQGRKVLYCLNHGQIETSLEAIKSLCKIGGTK